MQNNEFYKYATKHIGIPSLTLDEFAKKTSANFTAPNIQNMTPAVIEEREMKFREIDIFTRLMVDRIIFLGLPIYPEVANVVQAQLLFLESADPKRDVQMFINSPGGSIIDGMGIYDTMQYINPHVGTTCTSMAASMGAILLTAGQKGKRSALPHSRVMIHQPLGGMRGQVSNMEIEYKLIKHMQKQLYDILAETTGQPYEVIERDCDRDTWLKAPDAKAYGLIDEVLTRKKAI
jgi:ATP-dependent Clp protease, protease subunit